MLACWVAMLHYVDPAPQPADRRRAFSEALNIAESARRLRSLRRVTSRERRDLADRTQLERGAPLADDARDRGC